MRGRPLLFPVQLATYALYTFAKVPVGGGGIIARVPRLRDGNIRKLKRQAEYVHSEACYGRLHEVLRDGRHEVRTRRSNQSDVWRGNYQRYIPPEFLRR